MPKLLFCWELGANFGHLSNIAALRPRLAAEGYELVFAVSDLRVARELLGTDSTVIQAPVWPPYAHQGSTVALSSFADVLTLVGFGQRTHLGAVVDAWLGLLRMVNPTALIVDHSPAAQLAAFIAERPVVALGTAFTMPPIGYQTFPLLRADLAPALPESELLASARVVASRHTARPLPQYLPALFAAEARVIIGLPELDPYRSFRQESLCAPVGGFAQPVLVEQTRLFVYLGAELPALASKLQIICDLPCPVEIYIRGADPLMLEFIRLRGKTGHERPQNSREVMARVSHVISQGGAMIASEALAAGRPNFVMPSHQESKINAVLLQSGGFGREFPLSDTNPTNFSQQLTSFLANRDSASHTLDVAKVLATRSLPEAGALVLQALHRIAQRDDNFAAAPLAAPSS